MARRRGPAPDGEPRLAPLEPVGPLVARVLRRLGLQRRLDERRALVAWETVVGPAITAQARPVDVRDGVLFVEVASNVWMQELALMRDDILSRLNTYLGAPRVRKIVLSIERAPLAASSSGEEEGVHE